MKSVLITPTYWTVQRATHKGSTQIGALLCPCLFRPSDNVWRSRRADEHRCTHFSTVISPSWITEQISEGKCTHQGASGVPNKFQNCHLDKTNMDKTSQHLIWIRVEIEESFPPPPWCIFNRCQTFPNSSRKWHLAHTVTSYAYTGPVPCTKSVKNVYLL